MSKRILFMVSPMKRASNLTISKTVFSFVYNSVVYTHQQLLALNQRTRRGERVFLLQSRWKTCWRNRLLRRLSCRSAFGHQAEFHVPGSTTPNKRFQSELRLDQRGLKYTHALFGVQSKKRNKVRLRRYTWPNANRSLHLIFEWFF